MSGTEFKVFILISLFFSVIVFGVDSFNFIDEFKFDLINLPSSFSQEYSFLFAGSFFLDEPVNSFFPSSDFLEKFNDLNLLHFSLLAVGVAAVISPFDTYTAYTVLESFVVTAAITGVIKFFVGRGRPYAEKNAFVFKPFSIEESYQSFPSGHSSLSWAIFTPVARRFGDFWYAIPSIFSLQRLWSNNHWLSDVLYGGFLGFSVGNSFYNSKINY
ncbi:phosphatase PAP2 family protein [Fervidobacterium sp.]